MLDDNALTKMRPLVLTPAYGGVVTAAFTLSLVALTNMAWQRNLRLDIRVTNGSSLITRARNEMLVDFLENAEYTHVIWIDGDIGFGPASLVRMLLADLDVVAGAYPMKEFGWPVQLDAGTQQLGREDFERMALRYPVNSHAAAGLSGEVDTQGFLEVTEAPTGFMVIKRQVFDRLIAAYPDLQYVPDGPPRAPARQALYYRFFDVMTDPSTRRYLSEDYAFCHRWRALGGKVHIDTTAALTHTGTYEFRGRYSDALLTRSCQALGGG